MTIVLWDGIFVLLLKRISEAPGKFTKMHRCEPTTPLISWIVYFHLFSSPHSFFHSHSLLEARSWLVPMWVSFFFLVFPPPIILQTLFRISALNCGLGSIFTIEHHIKMLVTIINPDLEADQLGFPPHVHYVYIVVITVTVCQQMYAGRSSTIHYVPVPDSVTGFPGLRVAEVVTTPACHIMRFGSDSH